MTEGHAGSDKRGLPRRPRRVITAAMVVAAMMAAQASYAGYAQAQECPPNDPDCNPAPPPPPPSPPGGGGNGGGGGGSFQSQSSSQGESQSRSVVSSTESVDGFAFPSFYYGFFPFGF